MSQGLEKLGFPEGKQLGLFGYVALGWLLIGLLLSFLFDTQFGSGAGVSGGVGPALGAVAGLWALCLLDLGALARLLSVVFQLMDSEGQKKPIFFIQAVFWGSLKLICLGLFFLTLLKGQKIPLHGLLLGMGTLGVVPVVGGFIWSQRILQNA